MQRDSETPDPILGPVFRIVDSKDDPLPEDVNPPTIVISCIPTKDINGTCSVDTSLPDNWLSSPTGGVVIEVRTQTRYRLFLCSLLSTALIHTTEHAAYETDKRSN
jgi:hypothetical protein